MSSTPSSARSAVTATSPSARRSIWRAGLITAVVAAVLNTLVYLIGQLTPAGWEVTQGGETQIVPWFLPAVASIMGIAAGTVALWVLARFSWGLLVWTIAAVLVAFGSTTQPLLAAEDTWTGLVLGLMHLVALVAALLLLRPAGRRTA